MCMLYGQSKLKALVMNIAMQRIKAVEAADMSDMLCTCKTQWYIMGMLIIITFYIMLKQGKTWFTLVPEPRNISVANDNS